MSRFQSKSSSFSSFRSKRDNQPTTQEAAGIFGVSLKKAKVPGLQTSGELAKTKTQTQTKKTTTITTTKKSGEKKVETKHVKTKTTTSKEKTTPAKTTNNTNTTISDQRILKSTRINIDLEKIPDFAIARPRILPVLKPNSWEKSTKDMLKKIDPKHGPEVLFFPVKTLPDSPLGYTLAIVNEEGSMQYILRSYLDAWNISEKVLIDVAIRNLEHRLENRGTRLWKRSKAGVYYLDNLGAVSASVILLPQFLDGLDIEDGDPVIVAPCGDICMVGGAKSDTQLCIIGEIALQYSKDPHRFDIKPQRFTKNRLLEYSPKTYAQEHNVPQTLDEVRTIKLRLKPLKIKREK